MRFRAPKKSEQFMSQPSEKIQEVLNLIEQGGATLNSCKRANITVMELYNWVDEDEDNRTAWRRLMDSRKLIVEDALFANAIKGNPIAQLFFLKCRDPHNFNEYAGQQVKAEGAKFKRRLFDVEMKDVLPEPVSKSRKKKDIEKEILKQLSDKKNDIKRVRVLEEELSEGA